MKKKCGLWYLPWQSLVKFTPLNSELIFRLPIELLTYALNQDISISTSTLQAAYSTFCANSKPSVHYTALRRAGQTIAPPRRERALDTGRRTLPNRKS